MEKEFILSNINAWLGSAGSITSIIAFLVTCITGGIKFIEKYRNGVAYRKGKIGPVHDETSKSYWKNILSSLYEEFTIVIVTALLLLEMKTVLMILTYRSAADKKVTDMLGLLIFILLLIFNCIGGLCFKQLEGKRDKTKCIILAGCDVYLLNVIFLLIVTKKEILQIVMIVASLVLAACTVIIGRSFELNYKYIVVKICKIIRCVMLALYVVMIFIWENAGVYVRAITLVWMGLAVFEYIYIIIFKQENEKIKIITIYGEDITQGAIKRYQGNKVQYKTIKGKNLILSLEDIERIEYERQYWNNRERKKLEKQEVKCELYNGNILAGNQVMILNEDWIRLEIQENTDILVKILKCKDVRKVEMIHK
jgi:hypothetical protein